MPEESLGNLLKSPIRNPQSAIRNGKKGGAKWLKKDQSLQENG
ncbi:MAG: hypothetical protein QME81_11370 [bacterium]|nr:hypothetical protein [bacterium]